MTHPYRVLIVDDHAHAREAMRCIVQQDSSFEIVGEGNSGEEALRLAEELLPDLILMDIHMKGMNGLEASKAIKDKLPATKIVIVTVSDDGLHLLDALKKGASGYLIKNLTPSVWIDYLKGVLSDDMPLSRDFAYRLLREITLQPQSEPLPTPLTAREKEILSWVAQGASNREIADRLFISGHTVKNHMKNILYKLRLDNRVQLARFAIENKLSRHK
ncbi:response regulator [Cohnella sp. GCM10027633]|uniref:response regulator n=1 Tax=unclassified Cohnella TaxID=2636738 RepID=UPI00363D38D5